jgi:anti-sigma regulatory factor (Ser/Thr protein kinase)
MVGIRKRGEQIRQFILDNVEQHPVDITTITCEKFAISRQAVNKHIQKLVEQRAMVVKGVTRSRHYSLHPLIEWTHTFSLDRSIPEDVVWRDYVAPLLGKLPDNVMDIWHYGITEMFNNAIDHSNGQYAIVKLKKTATSLEVIILDDGEGIFKKIQRELGLHDERHAVLELAKGKLTTDPRNHSGEGIFFSSRMFDHFTILSGNVFFSHKHDQIEDWILEDETSTKGTYVFMKLTSNTARTLKQVFDKFTCGDDYGFTKTVVPVRLTQYGDDKLVSRSQAKRLLARIDKFKQVIFDFSDVESIGQAFADEIFRVFANNHVDIELMAINSNVEVQQMINRASSSFKSMDFSKKVSE